MTEKMSNMFTVIENNKYVIYFTFQKWDLKLVNMVLWT